MMKTLINILCAFACLLASSNAFATHKSWVMKNGASECQFVDPIAGNSNLTGGGPLLNNRNYQRTVSCPLTLANRWISTGTRQTYYRGDAQVLEATVNIRRQRRTNAVSCKGVMKATNNVIYYSSTASTLTNGYSELRVAHLGEWGGALEANDTLEVAGLSFSCNLSPNASILGYRAKMCQNNDCSSSEHEDTVVSASQSARTAIQTSGIECVGTFPGDRVARSSSGIRAVEAGFSGNGGAIVFCPLIPAADDSYETRQVVFKPTVYFSGMSTSLNCVGQGTCPKCRLRWWDRKGKTYQSDYFERATGVESGTQVVSLSGFTKLEVDSHVDEQVGHTQAGIACILPEGGTIIGASAATSLYTTDDFGQ